MTRVISGTVLPGPCSARYFAAAQDPCALPRCAVPSPGKPCLSCTHHDQSFAPEEAIGAACSLTAASNCCKVHLLPTKSPPPNFSSSSRYKGCRSPSPLRYRAAGHPCVALSCCGYWIQISRYEKNSRGPQTNIYRCYSLAFVLFGHQFPAQLNALRICSPCKGPVYLFLLVLTLRDVFLSPSPSLMTLS